MSAAGRDSLITLSWATLTHNIGSFGTPARLQLTPGICQIFFPYVVPCIPNENDAEPSIVPSGAEFVCDSHLGADAQRSAFLGSQVSFELAGRDHARGTSSLGLFQLGRLRLAAIVEHHGIIYAR